ncbi:MAG: hypothetical protein IPM12_02000 [Flavobacteriales bacterium]|nr:hypothetical protein [Flavobacteriales bacterium]
MDAEAAHRLYRMLGGDSFAFVHAGSFNEGHTADLIALGDLAAKGSGRPRTLRQRLAFVLVEAYQNVTRHRALVRPGARECSFTVRANADRDSVSAMNPISRSEAAALDEALDRLRGATTDQLRGLFLARLSTGGATARGGAGLGLIEMARRSGRDLCHRIIPIDQDRSLFAIRAVMSPDQDERQSEAHLDADLELHRNALDMGLVMAIRCGGEAGLQEPVLRMLERELDDPAIRQHAGQAYLAASSWMNAHGVGRAALFCFGTADGSFWMRAVWSAAEPVMSRMVHKVESIAELSRLELDRRYRRAVIGNEEDAEEIGLLELARIQRKALIVEQQEGLASFAVAL